MTIEVEAGLLVEKTLKQIGEEAIAKAEQQLQDTKALNGAIEAVGEHLEREALTQYKHNETWALRGVARDIVHGEDYEEIRHKFRQEVAQELTPEQLARFPMEDVLTGLEETIQDYLIGVTKLWQKETFDPVTSFRNRLDVEGRSKGTIKESLCVAARFVGKYGRKTHYSDTEIMDFLYAEKERMSENSFCTKRALLKTFITSVEPERQFPVKVKSYKGQTYSPTLSKEQVDALILAGNVFLDDVDKLRLAVMTIYGARAGEIAALSYKDIDLVARTITIVREKSGVTRSQPIPESLMFVFAAPIQSCGVSSIQKKIKKWGRLAGFRLASGVGVHSIRSRVITELKMMGIDTYDIYSFMCWSKHSFGMLPHYIKIPQEVSDTKILEVHPFVKSWEESICSCKNIILFFANDNLFHFGIIEQLAAFVA